MDPKFATWTDLGTHTFGPNDQVVDVGAVTLVEGADTLWIRVTQMSGPTPWPWSYGIAAFQSIEGRSLGSVKAFGTPSGEVVRLGVGLPPLVRDGRLLFEPRGFNLAWIRNGNPWQLNFEVRSGVTTVAASGGGTVRFPFTDLTSDLPFLLAPGNAFAHIDLR
jgi:hypothetical protein